MSASFEAVTAQIVLKFIVMNQCIISVNLPVKRILLRSTAEAFRLNSEKEADPENEDRCRRVVAATGRRLASRAWFEAGFAAELKQVADF